MGEAHSAQLSSAPAQRRHRRELRRWVRRRSPLPRCAGEPWPALSAPIPSDPRCRGPRGSPGSPSPWVAGRPRRAGRELADVARPGVGEQPISATAGDSWVTAFRLRAALRATKCCPSSRSAQCWSARATANPSSSISNGVVSMSKAPALMDATAVSMVPNAVMTITGKSGRLPTTRRHGSMPLAPRIRTSVTTTSKGSASSAASAPSPVEVAVTTWP